MVFCVSSDFGLGLLKHGFEAGYDVPFRPQVTLEVLDPLKIRNGHTAGIAEHVRDNEDVSSFIEDAVGLRSGGAVRSLC